MQIHSWSLYSEAALLLLQEASQHPVDWKLTVETEPLHITMILFYFDFGLAAPIFEVMLYKNIQFF